MSDLSTQWLAWMAPACWQLALLVCVVALATALARPTSARFRHALWLLVIVKVFLPPSLWTPVSAGHWGVGPLLDNISFSQTNARPLLSPERAEHESAVSIPSAHSPAATHETLAVSALLMSVWAAGCLGYWAIIGWRYRQLMRLTRAAACVDEGPARVALEQIALQLNVRRVPDLLVAKTTCSPFLLGVLHPRIVLPAGMLESLDSRELTTVLTHELVHWKRRDTWIGWLQLAAQSLFWFHPFLWWANSQLRHERECACDEAVLRAGRITPQQYGESILRLLNASRGRSFHVGSHVGVFERGAKLQERLEHVMNFKCKANDRNLAWAGRLALLAFAVVFLPLASGDKPRQLANAQVGKKTPQANRTSYPQTTATTPKHGATEVDPDAREIRVTFDRNMGQGMSWTGGPPWFPPTDNSRNARWIDARTCVLPVKLSPGRYYRVGINSTSHQNFRSADGMPVPPRVICFTTRGATPEVQRRVKAPKIVKLEPENGATSVDPQTKSLTVTFDMPMGEGMSWTGGGPQFPKIPDGQRARWSRDGAVCALPVALQPNHQYQLGLNSLNHINFQSKWGVPLSPVTYKFRTAARQE